MPDQDNFKFDDKENQFNNSENDAPDTEENEQITLPHTIQLSVPIVLSKRTITELVFKRPVTVGLMKHIPASEDMSGLKIGHFIPIIAGMTGESSVVIEKLVTPDFMKCTEVTSHFL